MLRRITKSLFCRKEAGGCNSQIVDGVLVEELEPPFLEDQVGLNADEVIAQKSAGETETLPQEVEKLSPEKKEIPPLPASGLPKQYIIHLNAAGRSPGTIQEYGWDLHWWQRQAGNLTDITLPVVEKTIQDMHPCTAQRKIASLRSYAKWLLRSDETALHGQLSQIILPKTPGRIPRDRGAEAFRDLSQKAQELTGKDDRRGVWIGLMLCCGLRISEIQTTQLTPGDTIKVKGKGNKERLIPAPGWLRSAIARKQKKTNQWRKGRHLIWKELKKMEITHPHSLRHTYASELVRQGFSLEQVQRLLGHAQLETSLIYAKIQVPDNVTERLGIE